MTTTTTTPTARPDHRTTVPVDDLDSVDAHILAERIRARALLSGPRIGDMVRFADGITRWFAIDHGPDHGIQTASAGGFYLSANGGRLEFSGIPQPSVKYDTLTLTGEQVTVGAWFFHHHRAGTDNHIAVEVPARVYECSLTAPEARQRITMTELGGIVLAEAGEEACQSGYGTADPELVGRLALQYGDITPDGTLN